MKKLAAVLLVGLTVFASVSHAYEEGETMPCGKKYYKSTLRSSPEGTLTAANKPARQGIDGTSFGPGVRRNN